MPPDISGSLNTRALRHAWCLVLLCAIAALLPHTTEAATTLLKPPNNLGLVGYWSFNEGTSTTATDFSGNRNAGTLTTSGAGAPTWVDGKRGKALDFVFNAGGYLSLGNTLDISALPLTASAWIRLDPAGIGFHRAIINKRDSFAAGDMRFQLHVSPDNFIGLDHPTGNVFFTNYTAPFQTWIHVTVVASSTGSALYINGEFQEQGGVYTLGTDAGAQVYIGSNPDFDDFRGEMDELRLYNRALGPTEIAKLYQSGAVKFNANSASLDDGSSLQNGLVGHWTFDGADVTDKIYDRSGSNNHGYWNGGATSSAKVIGKLGQALQFDGVNDRVLEPGISFSSTFSVGMWLNLAQAVPGSSEYVFFAIEDDCYFFLNDTEILEYFNNGGAGSGTFGTAFTPRVWRHVAFVHSGGTLTVYVDGAAFGSPLSSTFQCTGNVPVEIGASNANGGFFAGTIDDVRVYNRALTAAEVKQLYKLGTVLIRQ